MSFSKTVKDEIIKKNIFKKETKALVQGLILSCGSLIISNSKFSFVASNENNNVMLLLKDRLLELYPDACINIIKIVKNFKQKERFELAVDGDLNEKILFDLGILYKEDGSVAISDVCDKSFMKSEAQMTAFLAGIFLGSGTISVPSTTEEGTKRKYGYHFEVVFSTEAQADIVAEIFSNFDIFPKKIERNEQYVVYLKNSEAICDVLSLFGSSKVVLDLLSSKVSRDLSNNTNRQMNCYSANADKTAIAAVKQIKAIEILQNTVGLENLPDTLAEAALARLSNPESSLSDLLNVLDNKISKGALAQRFNKIIALAKELGEEDEK